MKATDKINFKAIWITELIVWILLILGTIFLFSYIFITAEQKNHSYYLFFKDVDGLTKGSIVRMMGYKIGYVRDVKVFNDNIFVSFLVTEKDVYIPYGSSAIVEFYGLGGSKSLEIYPPEVIPKSDTVPAIITKYPYRISGYFDSGEKINRLLETMSKNLSLSLKAVSIDNINIFIDKNIQNINDMLEYYSEETNKFLKNNQRIKKDEDLDILDDLNNTN